MAGHEERDRHPPRHRLGRRRPARRARAADGRRVAGGGLAVPLSLHRLERPGLASPPIELQIKGPNVTITQKDPAALNALFYGRLLLTDERADALLVGAADEWNLDYHLAYERVRATRTTATRPGFVLGEGCCRASSSRTEPRRARGAPASGRASPRSSCVRRARLAAAAPRAGPRTLAATIRAALAEAGVAPSRRRPRPPLGERRPGIDARRGGRPRRRSSARPPRVGRGQGCRSARTPAPAPSSSPSRRTSSARAP